MTADDDVDLLIIGAGLSGIGLAYQLQRDLPHLRYVIAEARQAIGGTWDLFRYPGVRSDSDLYTFGYRFRPWRDDIAIADGASILRYIQDSAADYSITDRIRLGTRVVEAAWSSAIGRWSVVVEDADSEERRTVTARWLFSAAGYYRYDSGYAPRFPEQERFRGEIVHPQQWPEDRSFAGERVVVIGSGATAVTLVPALAAQGAEVTMVQRTPTYILSVPSVDTTALRLRRVFGDRLGHTLARSKGIAVQRVLWLLARGLPRLTRALIRRSATKQLPPGFPVDVHFNPPYNPWDQRLCLVPDGDFFAAIREGHATVVTDVIDTFTETGIRLRSGQTIDADVIVTATGLELQLMGGVRLSVDDSEVDLAEHISYKGVMLDGIPNFGYAIGYTNATWTLKVGLLCEYFTRLLADMHQRGVEVCVPVRPAGEATRPLLDFAAGYVVRAAAVLPRQGARAPWRMSMNYYADARRLRWAPVRDKHLRFSNPSSPATAGARQQVAGRGVQR